MHLTSVVESLVPGLSTAKWALAHKGAIAAGVVGTAAAYYGAPKAIKYFREKRKREKGLAEQQAELEAEVGEEKALRKKKSEKETDDEEEEKPKKGDKKKKTKKNEKETDDEGEGDKKKKKKEKGDGKSGTETAEWSSSTKISLISLVVIFVAAIGFWLYRMSLVPN